MKIEEISLRDKSICAQLLDVWEKSVRATHLFLKEEDIVNIREQVTPAIKHVEKLLAAWDENNELVGFMGIQGKSLEMLFIHPQNRGKGLGRQLLQKAVCDYGVEKLDVNEQNPQAKGFYEHMGFEVSGRSESDDLGNPFPILHMILKKIS